MVEFPKIFLKVEDLGNKRGRVTISEEKAGENSECWSNIDENNNEINHYYMAIYPAAVYNGLSRSISGSSVYYSNYSVLCNHGYTEKINETVGKKQWSGFIRSDFQILRFLLMLITKTTDISGAIGYGNCFNDTLLTPGSMDKKGLFYGENTGMSGVKAFGIENLWGNAGTAIYGQFCSVSSTGAKYYVKMTKGKYDGSNIIGYSTGKENLIEIDTDFFNNNGNTLSEVQFTKYGLLPKASKGFSESQHLKGYTDNVSVAPSTGAYFPIYLPKMAIGSDGLSLGLFSECIDVKSTENTGNKHICERISCKPVKGNGNN